MNARAVKVGILLMGSGMCALIYQVAWLREFRLVFGGSTAASAAVLAIFMGGLGLGGIVLGRRAERHLSPLDLYAKLEFSIAATAVISPFLILFIRAIYIALGGSVVLGMTVATLLRLALASAVLGIPTFLMGGTLPAAAKAVVTQEDVSRRGVALLYGLNTLGAVFGAAVSTFYMLEVFGTRNTLWLACLLNVLVALGARVLARTFSNAPETAETVAQASPTSDSASVDGPRTPSSFVLVSAALAGFSFLLMELVWYRMLAPLLGGTTYTFGLILAVALLGIGLGGAAYSLFASRLPATLRAFTITVGLEALFVAIPFALGDRLAVFSVILRPLGVLGFSGHIAGWAMVCAIVILPAAIVSGFQFPLLIALLGRGNEDVGRQTGLAYAWNTFGAILGSLAGGFGLLPLLTAPGAWKAVVYILGALGLASALLSIRIEKHPARAALPVGVLIGAILLVLLPVGPTAAWRHSAIGAGRTRIDTKDAAALENSINYIRRNTLQEMEGLECSVALNGIGGLAFFVNGKADGNAVGDAPTQVMSGLIGAILHPQPRSCFIVGLGTGSTAGWLAKVKGMERVDVVELEPAILEVARQCAPVNQDVMNNPDVNIIIGDAREVLLTTPERYDLIFSEPSNPYRVGIASLYTREFYEAAARRLRGGGIFVQFVQAYEVDSQTIRTIHATLSSVFNYVETWQSKPADMILVCSMEPIRYPIPELRERIREEPFRSALAWTWRATDLEGFLARYAAGPPMAAAIAQQEGAWLNTDDRTLVEFGFARTLGRVDLFDIEEVRRLAREMNWHRPDTVGGEVDWDRVDELFLHLITLENLAVSPSSGLSEERNCRARALGAFIEGDYQGVLDAWNAQPREARYPIEQTMVAEALANAGDPGALPLIAALREFQPTEADAILARLYWREGKAQEAADTLISAFLGYRTHPWALTCVTARAFALAHEIASKEPSLAEGIAGALDRPFAVYYADETRRHTALRVAAQLGDAQAAPYVEAFEPHIPWDEDFLRIRSNAYQAAGHPLASQAATDLRRFLKGESTRFKPLFLYKATHEGS